MGLSNLFRLGIFARHTSLGGFSGVTVQIPDRPEFLFLFVVLVYALVQSPVESSKRAAPDDAQTCRTFQHVLQAMGFLSRIQTFAEVADDVRMEGGPRGCLRGIRIGNAIYVGFHRLVTERVEQVASEFQHRAVHRVIASAGCASDGGILFNFIVPDPAGPKFSVGTYALRGSESHVQQKKGEPRLEG